MLSPKPQESVRFLALVMGLEVAGSEGQSVYLRGLGDSFYHSLKVTEAAHAGLGHIGWRAMGEEALDSAARELAATGLGQGWTDGDAGHGQAYRFSSPAGHVNEVFWDVEWSHATDEQLMDTPADASTATDCGARRIDHATMSSLQVASERDFFVQHLGFNFMEGRFIDEQNESVAFLTNNETSHELGFVFEPAGGEQLNHVAFSVDRREDIQSAHAVLRCHGLDCERGPLDYLAGAASFLYVREPGGNRIELCSRRHQVFSPNPVSRLRLAN